MPASQQVLNTIKIDQLKGLRDLEIDLSENQLTAILGPNGIGKSTIIHALSCVYNPVQSTVNHRLSEFFTPTTHSIWNGSSFHIYQDYREQQNTFTDHHTHFRKQASRWAPRYVRRIERYVSFIGIRTCVPIIESETQQSRIQFNTTPLNDNNSNQIQAIAGIIMNRNYTSYNAHRTASNKKYIGVSNGNLSYSSLSMGAGEQRIFYILSEVIKSPNYGLILIDEIDLLLHQDALVRLLQQINIIAQHKHLQVIFTTHSHSILHLSFISFNHLYQTPIKTLCFTEAKPDTLQRLTGHQLKPIEIFVEDDLALYLIKKICSEEGMSRYVSIKGFGAAINCFTSVSGAILNAVENLDNMLFVLDGDEYKTDELKRTNINRVLTGTPLEFQEKRNLAFSKISQFIIPDATKPEVYYHSLICGLDDNELGEDEQEITHIARQIINPDNSHKFLDDIITRLSYDRPVGLSKLVDLISKTAEWPLIKQNIQNWLIIKKEVVAEN